MSWVRALAAALLVVSASSACADVGGTGDGPPDHPTEPLSQWAAEVADAWAATDRDPAWRTGYVPLQDPTVVDGTLTDAEKQALAAGWFTTSVDLPAARPGDGTIRFPSGTLPVPLVSAEEAYEQLDQGDPPPCPDPLLSLDPPAPGPPPAGPSPTGPDTSVSSGAVGSCEALTVTGVELGTAAIRTSRGEAEVPAWRFRVSPDAVVARVAVAASATGQVPEPAPTPTNREAPREMVAAQSLDPVDGADLEVRLGVGACDTDITPVVVERADVVAVAGGVSRTDGVCTDQLLLHPVTVTLTDPLGDRPVIDGLTGQLLQGRAPY